MIDAFLKFQRDNQQYASVMESTNGKVGEKAVFSPYGGDEADTSLWQSLLFSMALSWHVVISSP